MMPDITYLTTTGDDIDELMLTLREEDRIELEIGTGLEARDVIEQSIWNSHEVGTLRIDGRLMAIVGLGSTDMYDDVDTGVPWLVGSTAIEDHKATFTRWTRERVQLFLREYPTLGNLVYAGNDRSVEWLETLGFRLLPAVEFGPNDALFHPFVIERGA